MCAVGRPEPLRLTVASGARGARSDGEHADREGGSRAGGVALIFGTAGPLHRREPRA
jgi:hypothetical protein